MQSCAAPAFVSGPLSSGDVLPALQVLRWTSARSAQYAVGVEHLSLIQLLGRGSIFVLGGRVGSQWGVHMYNKTGLSSALPRARGAARHRTRSASWLLFALVICLALGVSSAFAAGPGTLVDAGFESRTDGTALDPGIWTLFGAPAKAEYDTLRAKNGSLSAWIQGSAATAYTGVIESETGAMSSDGAEIRFWTYFDTTSTGRLVDDIDPSINNAARAFLVNFQNNGALSVYTSKAGNPGGYTTNAYTPVGTYTTGWTQYRLVMDFTNQTYTLSSRANAADAWTQIKAPGATGYGIPMLSASPVTATHGTRWRSYYAAQWWVDDIAYSPTGISDPDTTAPAVPTGLSATPDTAQVALSWNANTEPDLSGYNVYRDGVLLTPVPVPAAAYTDALLIDGTYAYTVSAVDATGNESARCPAVSATVGTVTPPSSGTLVDAGFESRTDAAALDASIWTRFGAPAKAEYDTLRAKNGSLSAWIQGSASTAYTGVIETKTGAMSTDGAEIRFWTYFDNTTTGRLVDDVDPSINNAARAFLVNFQNNGALSVYTSKAGSPNGYTTNAYTPVGTYTTGWTQYRLVMDFSTQTYTLSSRANAADAWTQIKAPGATGYGIPMLSASPVSATHGTRWRSYYAAQWWVDDIAYSPTGISDGPAPDTTPPAVPAGLAAVGGTRQVALTWNANTEPDLAGYDVLRDGVKVNTTRLTATSFTDTGLADSTSYSYRIVATDTSGNSSTGAAVSATTVDGAPPFGGTLVDSGFESRADGTALDSSVWTLFGAPARAEYDTLRSRNGSLSAWIQGSTSTAYTGVIETKTGAMSSDGAEIRFWTYFDNTTTGRLVDDVDPSINNAARAFLVNFQNNGALSVYTSKAGNPGGYTTNAYTPVGTYTTGWTQYRLVMDFTNQTYTLSSRLGATDAWTQIKAPGATGYGIPMLSASPVTATHGTRWRSYYAASMWVDDIAYSDGIVAPVAYTLTYDGGTGTIIGTNPQTVNHGTDGTAVTAVPAAGYSFVGWSDGSTANPRTDTNVTADKSVTALFEVDRFALDYSSNPIDIAPVLSPTKAAGAWYTDRRAPAAFEKAAFDAGDRLHVGISSAGYDAVNDFYNTQGRKFDLTDAKFAQADLYVGADWGAENRRADLWATAVNAAGAVKGYPIIGFVNGTGFRVWDNNQWHTVGFPAGFSYGKWYSLKMMLNPTSVTYYIDDELVFTSTFVADPAMADAVKFDNLMLQAKNFNNSYDVYWDNVSSTNVDPQGSVTGANPQVVDYGTDGTAVTAVPAAGYHFVKWSDGVTTASRTDTNVTADKSVTASFEVDRFALDYSSNPFDIAPVLSATKAAGVWYTDRRAPAAFEKAAFDGGDRLHLAINSAGYDAASDFYNTQGRKFDLTDAKLAQADLYVGADWGTETRRADLWTTAVDGSGGVTGYPIIGFVNGTGFRVWDNNQWHTVGFPAGFSYGKWYSLKMMLNPTSVTYFIDDKLVFTSTFKDDPEMAAAVKFDNLMLQAKNFNNSYDVYWDNVSSTNVDPHGSVTGPNPQVVDYNTDGTAVTAVPAAGYSFVGWSDGSTANPRTDANVTADKSVTALFEVAEVRVPVVIGGLRTVGTGMIVSGSQHQVGSGSWQFLKSGGTSKAEFYLVPPVDLGTSFTVADIKSIAYNTYNHANPAPVDFYVTLYTAGTAHGWYEQRLTTEPYLKSGAPYVPVLDSWRSWTTEGSEALTFFDSNNCGNFGFYGAPTLQQIQSGAINWSTLPSNPTQGASTGTPIDYASQGVKYIAFGTGSGWSGFDGYLDGITIALKNGTTYDVDLEATP